MGTAPDLWGTHGICFKVGGVRHLGLVISEGAQVELLGAAGPDTFVGYHGDDGQAALGLVGNGSSCPFPLAQAVSGQGALLPVPPPPLPGWGCHRLMS